MSIYENIDLVAKAESYLAQAENALQLWAGNQSASLLTACQTMIQLAEGFLCLNDCYEDADEESADMSSDY